MRLRIRSPQQTFSLTLPSDADISSLVGEILKNTKTDHSWTVSFGYPLHELDLSVPTTRLTDAGIGDSETLILAPSSSSNAQVTRGVGRLNPTAAAAPSKPQMVLREIADDNSCLFSAIGYVLEDRSRSLAPRLRKRVSEYILSHPDRFTEAVLGRDPKSYAEWIRKDTSWGGAIELSIFSDIYQTEIASFDVKTGRMDLFGEDRCHPSRVYLQYTGIHYEAFALALGQDAASESFDVTIFSPQDSTALEQVKELVQVAQLTHRFTDTTSFTLRCEHCGTGLRGETEAQKHAKATGHSSFAEYLE